MKTITALDLRNNMEVIVKALRRGESMSLTYRGERVADLHPAAPADSAQQAVAALRRAWAATDEVAGYSDKAEAYLREMREDQQNFGARADS